MDEKLNKDDIRFIKQVLKIYHNMLEESNYLIDINSADNETNLKFCHSILRKKSLLRLEIEEWRFISDMLENYYEVLKMRSKHYNFWRTNSDEQADTWYSIDKCNDLLVKIDRYI
jgi:hypothetical protein